LETEKYSFYEDLFYRWREESSNKRLNPLPQNYYQRIGEYIGQLKRQLKELDQKSTKAVLIKRELQQARKTAMDLVAARRLKIIRFATEGEPIATEDLTIEDKKLYNSIISAMNSFNEEIKRSFEGRVEPDVRAEKQKAPKRILVRFLREIPAIIGSDMRTYGPFKTEDIATLPADNAMALVKQGYAVKVEVPKDENP